MFFRNRPQQCDDRRFARDAFGGGRWGHGHRGRHFGGGTMSADSRYIAWESDAANLVGGDTNRSQDVFLRDRGPVFPVGGRIRAASALGFPAVAVGQSALKALAVRNESHTETLRLAAAVTGSSFALEEGSENLVLSPGASGSLAVRFSPASVGRAAGSLLLNTSDSSHRRLLVLLRGRSLER